MAVDDDAELIAGARAGDTAAFEQLVLRHQREVLVFLAARCRDPLQIEENLQGAFVQAWEHPEDYSGRGNFVGWVKVIARNLLMDDYRRRRRDSTVPVDALAGLIDAEFERRLGDPAAEEQVDLHRLQRCLAGLGDRARTLLHRHHVEGLSLNTLAQQFRKKRGAIAKTLYTLRARLRNCMLQESGR